MYCIKEYSELIKALLSKGYILRNFLLLESNTIYLRHDIDFSIKKLIKCTYRKRIGCQSKLFFHDKFKFLQLL